MRPRRENPANDVRDRNGVLLVHRHRPNCRTCAERKAQSKHVGEVAEALTQALGRIGELRAAKDRVVNVSGAQARKSSTKLATLRARLLKAREEFNAIEVTTG